MNRLLSEDSGSFLSHLVSHNGAQSLVIVLIGRALFIKATLILTNFRIVAGFAQGNVVTVRSLIAISNDWPSTATYVC